MLPNPDPPAKNEKSTAPDPVTPPEATEGDERAFLHTMGDDPAGWCEHALHRIRGLREYGPSMATDTFVPLCNRLEDLLVHIAAYFDPKGTHVVISRQFMDHLEREAGFDPDA